MLETSRATLLAAVGGTLARDGSRFPIRGVSTDTRSLRPGDLYVPLRGDRFDGHRFLEAAIDGGAAGFLFAADAGVAPDALVGDRDCFAIAVVDTLVALGDLAADAVRRLGVPVVGITGSAGKTSTKDMTAAILARVGPVCATVGNYNNLVGLPLSILRCGAADRFLVLEMGMSERGEIARLAAIGQPTIGVVTNVGEAHLAQLGSLDGVARAKGELYEALPAGALAVVNGDDPRVVGVYERSCRAARRTFGSAPAHDVRIEAPRIEADGTPTATLSVGGRRWELRPGVMGLHNLWNGAAAVAATLDLVPDPKTAVRALDHYPSAPGRMERLRFAGATIVSDAYNANPRSVAAALRTLAAVPGSHRRIAVLGDMLELGAHTEAAHRAVGRQVAELGFAHLLAAGAHASWTAAGARGAGLPEDRIRVAEDVTELVPPVRALLREGDWLLLKGSRGARMERLLESLGVG